MFIFYFLGVGFPCHSIFCQFWLCEDAQCVYLCRHLGCPSKVLSTKIEIKMKKPEAVRWEKLEGQGDVPKPNQFIADVKNLYPSSSHYTRNWDKLVGEIKE